jgi:hypothetical protein
VDSSEGVGEATLEDGIAGLPFGTLGYAVNAARPLAIEWDSSARLVFAKSGNVGSDGVTTSSWELGWNAPEREDDLLTYWDPGPDDEVEMRVSEGDLLFDGAGITSWHTDIDDIGELLGPPFGLGLGSASFIRAGGYGSDAWRYWQAYAGLGDLADDYPLILAESYGAEDGRGIFVDGRSGDILYEYQL